MNNFPDMTEAQRKQMVNWLEEGIACRDEYGFSGNVLKSMQIALAALTAHAEAFRSLEQRAEAAEAKLAELEKQEPVLFRDSQGCFISKGKGEQLIKSGEFVTPYYLRPVPPINLAELVPEERPVPPFKTYQAGLSIGFNACRAAILRKIEVAK